MIKVRPECPEDEEAVRAVNGKAFEGTAWAEVGLIVEVMV